MTSCPGLLCPPSIRFIVLTLALIATVVHSLTLPAMSLTGKNILITGGTSGIGLESAVKLSEAGETETLQ